MRQTRSVASQLPLAHRSPAGLAARLSTASVCPRHTAATSSGASAPLAPPAAPAACRRPQRASSSHEEKREVLTPGSNSQDTSNRTHQATQANQWPSTWAVKDDYSAGVPEKVIARFGL